MLSPVLYIGELCCHTDIWVLWYREGRVIWSLLLLDNVFKSWDKTRNNVGLKPEPQSYITACLRLSWLWPDDIYIRTYGVLLEVYLYTKAELCWSRILKVIVWHRLYTTNRRPQKNRQNHIAMRAVENWKSLTKLPMLAFWCLLFVIL